MNEPMPKPTNNQRYFTVWRWHFYAGIFAAPFLIVLAITALGMLFMSNTAGRDDDRLTVAIPELTSPAPVSIQAKNV